MAGELLRYGLAARAGVEIYDHVETGVGAPAYYSIEVRKGAAREGSVGLDQVFFDPESNGDSDCVETEAGDLYDVLPL